MNQDQRLVLEGKSKEELELWLDIFGSKIKLTQPDNSERFLEVETVSYRGTKSQSGDKVKFRVTLKPFEEGSN